MSEARTTIARVLTFEGRGLHSGAGSSVTLSPLPDGEGIRFLVGGRAFGIEESRVSDSRRCTSITFPDGSSLSTVEHMLSAIAGVGLDDVSIECPAVEVPILDGSAAPFAEKILEAGLVPKNSLKSEFHITVPICVDDGSSVITAIPSDKTRITYIIDYPGTGIGTEMVDVPLDREIFLSRIAPARTFALLSEVEALRSAGLAMGGSLENALVIGEDGPAGGASYRVDAECAAHKALDLIGDLILLGELPVASYICVKGGHRLHRKLTDRIRGMLSAKRRP